MANRVDISGDGKSAAKKSKGDEKGQGASGNAVKLAIVAVCFVLAGGVFYWNFLRQPKVVEVQKPLNPFEGLEPKEVERKKAEMEFREKELKRNPPAGS